LLPINVSSALRDSFGHVTERFDLLIAVEEACDPARAGLQSFVAPWKCTDDAALIKNAFDITADIFSVN